MALVPGVAQRGKLGTGTAGYDLGNSASGPSDLYATARTS
jgi:hypothetical protein